MKKETFEAKLNLVNLEWGHYLSLKSKINSLVFDFEAEEARVRYELDNMVIPLFVMRFNKDEEMMTIDEFDEIVFKKRWDKNGKEITDLTSFEEKLVDIDKQVCKVKDQI